MKFLGHIVISLLVQWCLLLETSAYPSEEAAPSASPSERCGPEALNYHKAIRVKVEKVGSVPVVNTASFSYNMQPMDNFSGDSIYFLDQLFGKVYSYNQATDTASTEPIFDMNTSELPDGVKLDWNLGSAGQTYKVKSMTKTLSPDEVILVMTSSTLPVGWDKADAEIPAKGAYSQWVCRPEDHFWMRDIFRPGDLPACSESDIGGMETFTGYDVFVTYTINNIGNLEKPRPFFVVENFVGASGNLGGGIATLDDGDILYSVGDCSHFGIDGTYPPQINSEHCGKIMRIKNSDTKWKYNVVAKGVRNPQQMRIFRREGQTLLGFMDIGGATAEEVNAYPLKKIVRAKLIQNFGWGRNQEDGKAREGTFYIGPGNGLTLDEPPCEESAPIGEAGFIQPWIQCGRSPTDFFYAISSFAVPTKGLKKLKLVWSEINTGMLLGTKENPEFGSKYKGPAKSFKIRLYDTSANELKNGFNDLVKEELGEVGYYRGDPRLFHYPDGSAGVFIERTGVFYKLEEVS